MLFIVRVIALSTGDKEEAPPLLGKAGGDKDVLL